MALSRSFLEGFGLNESQINAICEAHSETLEGLKAKITELKSLNEEYEKTKEQLKEVNEKLSKYEKDGLYKEKYDELNNQFEEYKKKTSLDKETMLKTNAYEKALKKIGVPESRIAKILKVSASDIDALEIDENGNIKSDIEDSLKEEWSDFILEDKGTQGAKTSTPPKTGAKVMSKDEIMNIKDTAERQKQLKIMLENEKR